MATRKRKSEITGDMLEPLVTKGSHLTVTKWPDGRTTLEWDDDQLLKEVQEATSSTPVQKTKKKATPKSGG